MGQRGFSLIEILIAIGVLSALIFIFMSLASNMSKEQASLQSKMDSLLVQSLMTRSILGDLDNCNLSLQNIPFNVTSPPNSFTIPHFVTGPASSISAFVRDPSSTRTDGILAKSLTMESVANDGAAENFAGLVTIEFSDRIRSQKKMIFPLKFKASVLTNQITGCRLASLSPSLVRLNKDVTQSYPANSCPGGFILEPSLTARRLGNNSNEIWVGVTLPEIDGTLHYDKSVEFGSSKTGGSGHGWLYFVKGLSRRYYLPPTEIDTSIDHSFTTRFYIGSRVSFDDNASAFSNFSSITSNGFIEMVEAQMLVSCLP